VEESPEEEKTVMRKFIIVPMLIATICCVTSIPQAEDLPPISLGSGQSTTQTTNGQTVEITVTGSLQATIYFENVQPTVIQGLAVRTSSGTTAGTVIIRWINTNTQQSIDLSPSVPSRQFSLEGGDGDKRGGPNQFQ
jgi:hypothetical protein